MIGALAIVAALLFVGGAIYRLAPGAPPSVRNLALIASLAAGALGLVHWSMIGDSRWLVGAILLLGAAYPGWRARDRRALMITALVLGLLGAALFGIAASRPMQRPAVTG